MSIYHDEVEIEDMEYDDESDMYYYPCPCGDKFQISKVETIRRFRRMNAPMPILFVYSAKSPKMPESTRQITYSSYCCLDRLSTELATGAFVMHHNNEGRHCTFCVINIQSMKKLDIKRTCTIFTVNSTYRFYLLTIYPYLAVCFSLC